MDGKRTSLRILRQALPSILFYSIAVLLIIVGDAISPSGPCVPGMGVMLFLFLPFFSTGLFLKNLFSALGPNKINKVAVAIHGMAVLVTATFFASAFF